MNIMVRISAEDGLKFKFIVASAKDASMSSVLRELIKNFNDQFHVPNDLVKSFKHTKRSNMKNIKDFKPM